MDDNDDVLMTRFKDEKQATWIVDSGANCHIAHEKQLLTDLSYNGQSICVAIGNTSKAKGKGICKIKVGDVTSCVNDVYYVLICCR